MSLSTKLASTGDTGETDMTLTITSDHMNVRSKLWLLGVSKLSLLQYVCADEDASSLERIIPHNAQYVVLP